MSNLVPSIVRTATPYIYGLVAAMLLKKFGYAIDEKTSGEMMAAISGLLSAGIYIAIRIAAKKYPKLELLLGTLNVPVYVTPKVAEIHARTARYNRSHGI